MRSIAPKCRRAFCILGMGASFAACSTPATDAQTDATALGDATPLSDGDPSVDGLILTDTATDVAAADVQALCLAASPTGVVFDPTPVASGAMASVKLSNCGLQGLCITSIDLQLQSAYVGEYGVTAKGLEAICPGIDTKNGPSVSKPCCIAPNTTAGLEVYFTPKSASSSPKTAQVWVTSNLGKTVILMQGIATGP